MTRFLTAAALIALTAIPVAAGGPVLIQEDTTEAAPDRKIGGLVVGLIFIAAIAALASGGDTCNGPEDPVEPPPADPC